MQALSANFFTEVNVESIVYGRVQELQGESDVFRDFFFSFS